MGKVKLTDLLKRRIALAMAVLAALMLLDCVYQIAMHVKWRSWTPVTLAAESPSTQPAETQPAETQPADSQPAASQPTETQPTGSQPTDTQPTGTQPTTTRSTATQPRSARSDVGRPGVTRKRTADKSPKGKRSAKASAVHPSIKKRDIMAPPKPKGHGLQLTGVLGNVALFKTRKGQTAGVEVGKSGNDIKVLKIDGYQVTIEYKGKPETMKLFSADRRRARPGRRSSGKSPSTRPTTRDAPTTNPTSKPSGAASESPT